MKKNLIKLGLGLSFIATFFLSQSVLACTTQTLIVGGKMTVCTVCGTVVSCMWGEYEKINDGISFCSNSGFCSGC